MRRSRRIGGTVLFAGRLQPTSIESQHHTLNVANYWDVVRLGVGRSNVKKGLMPTIQAPGLRRQTVFSLCLSNSIAGLRGFACNLKVVYTTRL